MGTKEWADERNAEWTRQLEHASLVAEVDVPDDEVDRALRVLGMQLRLRQIEGLTKFHPGLLLVSLTHAGMRGWEEGTFYQKVAELLDVQKADVELAVKGYHQALRKLRLPTFDDAKGMRWVTPVLLHGAVPLDHLDELLDLLAVRRRRDPSLTGESFVEWARLQPHALATQPRALSRFLEFGGDFAPDFVGRVIDLVDGNDVVLPQRSIERLRSLLVAGHGRTTSTREARPIIAMTPDNDVVVRLPAVRPSQGRTVAWRLRIGSVSIERHADVPWHERASKTRPESVPVGAPVREVTVEREGSSAVLPFVRKEDPLLVFDEDGDYVAPARPSAAGRLRLMWPGDSRPTLRTGELCGRERDVPYGWEGWSLLEMELDAGNAVRLGDGPWHRVAGAERARISVGPAVPGLLTSDGFEVTSKRPVVELPIDALPEAWTVAVEDTDGTARATKTCETLRAELPSLGDGPFVGDITVTVRGPLGRGLVRRVVVAEDTAIHAQPTYRPLAPGGGLVPCRVAVRHAGRTAIDLGLGERDRNVRFDLAGQHFVFEIDHPELALARGGVLGEWTSDPQSIETGAVAQYGLRVRGLRPGAAVRLCLASPRVEQEFRVTADRRGRASFPLASFAERAKRSGSGTLTLDDGGQPVPVVRLRPARLVSGAAIVEHGLLRAEPEVSTPLEVVLYRVVAPWEPGQVIPFDGSSVRIPAELVGRGTLRALFRVQDDWAPPDAPPYPRLGADAVDVLQAWDPDSEPDETRDVSAILAGCPTNHEARVGEAAATRVVELLASPDVIRDGPTRVRLATTLRRDPVAALRGISRSHSTTPELTGVVVECGLADVAVDDIEDTLDVEDLLVRSPLGAVLAASSALETSLGRSQHPGPLLAAQLGEDLLDLWRGAGDDAKLGRLEPAFEERPELVKLAYDYLAPVPGLMLDADTRIACVYELWQARRSLGEVAAHCMPSIRAAEKVVRPYSRELWAMVDARLSRDGVIALPALSIALALVSRLAAHRGATAALVAENQRSRFLALARRAPGLVAVDLVRADAAVIGASL